MRFAAAGFVCVDYYPDLKDRRYATGNGVDVLYNLLDMRDDIEGSVVSAIGDDALGRVLQDSFRENGIDASHLEVVPGARTASFGMLLNGRDRVHAYPDMGVMENYRFSEEALDFISRHDLIHTDFSGHLTRDLDRLRRHGAKIFFDFSKRREHPDFDHILQNIDCGIASYEEDGEDVRAFLRRGCSLGAGILIATLGEKGSVAYDGKDFYECGIVPTEELVNTVGAGDSYFAGFLSALLDGKGIQDCMSSGAARSSLVVSGFEPYARTKNGRQAEARQTR